MPTAILLAGPNGAGKTTFASQYLADGVDGFVFLNPDEIARHLQPDLSAIERTCVQAGCSSPAWTPSSRTGDFVVETTLSSALYARRIPEWKAAGYRVALIYLRLPDAEASVRRVAQRVSQGGHDIAEADLRRRHGRSLFNLETVYKPLVDEWRVWRGREGRSELLESSER